MREKQKFHVGDRVVRVVDTREHNSQCRIGDTGTIVDMLTHNLAGILWDNMITTGHSLGGILTGDRSHSGWNLPTDQIELLIEAEPISLDISEVL